MDSARAARQTEFSDSSSEDVPQQMQPSQTPEPVPGKISAYYSLAFPNSTYYLQTLTVTIGRRSVRPGSASSSDMPQVDVDLGPLKSVSRLHAKIEYEESQERFVLVVLGRNGAWVDGVWSGSGSRVPLSARSQIQIASRVFHFILPPPPAPEDSPSPSSPSSTTRHLSPSIDITSLSPASSLPSPSAANNDLPPTPVTMLPSPRHHVEKKKASAKLTAKKRKKPDEESRPPPPEVMPPRPTFTYAQLCYRAINALDGKATLQEICKWVSDNFDWYRYNEGSGWESSIRHNLSSNRAFKKMERCAGERGKGFFWSLDSRFAHLFEDHEGKNSTSLNGGKDGSRGKGKNSKPLEPPLKRSVKGDPKSALPPPLTSTPLPSFASQSAVSSAGPSRSQQPPPPLHLSISPPSTLAVSPVKKERDNTSTTSLNALGPVNNMIAQSAKPEIGSSSPALKLETLDNGTNQSSTTPNQLPMSSDVVVPIVIGPTSSSSAQDGSGRVLSIYELDSPPIALQRDTIILNPVIFSSLTPEQLKELEALGAKKAIEILQSYIVRFYKEKRKTEGKGKIKQKKNKGLKKKSVKEDGVDAGEISEAGQTLKQTTSPDAMASGGSGNSTTKSTPKLEPLSGPFTKTPLASRIVTHTYQGGSNGQSHHSVSTAPASVTPQDNSTPRLPSPPMASLEAPPYDEIDIMGDFDEPITKKRKLDVGQVAI